MFYFESHFFKLKGTTNNGLAAPGLGDLVKSGSSKKIASGRSISMNQMMNFWCMGRFNNIEPFNQQVCICFKII